MKNIIKRDGRLVSFDESKIYNAVLKAADSVSEEIEHNKAISESVKRRVIKELDTTYLDNNYPTVEEIQDLVIKMLINSREDKIANAYISYRNDRTRKREAKNKLMEGIKEITFASSKDSNLKRDNGNVNGDTPMGMMLQYGSLVSKQFSDDYLISEKIAKHMKDGDIYIHDKDFLPSGTLTCCQIPLDKLFKDGFNTGHGYIRTPQSIRSYASLAAIAIQSNQNDQHGGQSIPLFDYYLAPGITKTLKKEFKNKLQILFFALAQKKEDEKIEKIMESFSLDDFKLKNEAKLKLKLKEKMLELVNPQEADWLIDQAFSLALQATEKETYQAMESFIHNLNTMHCLPYHENIWVYDIQEKKLLLMSIGKLTENFERDRYYAVSLNTATQDAEFKKITAAQRKDNHRRIITLVTKCGQTVTTTDNHRILSYDEKCNCIVEKFPEVITHTLTPTCHNYEKLLKTCDEETLQPLLNVIKALSSSIDGHVKGNYMLYSIEIASKSEYNSHEEYVYDISVEDNENFLTKDCIFVHNSRAGAQVPFSSINFGMDTSEEGRMVSRNLLLAQEAGLGNGETPIFPILIFQVKEGVNYNPGDPNYDLFQLSLRVSAKRLFPNFVFVDAPFNLQYYNPEDPETIIATMGCVDKDEVITYKINQELYVESFSRAWNRLINLFEIKKNGLSEYFDLKNVTIYDSSSGDFVECKKMIRNPDMNNWYKVKFSGGRTLTATADHPLPIKNKGRTFVQDLEIGDEASLADRTVIKVEAIEFLGYRNEFSYDVETSSDFFDVSGILSHNCRTRVIGNVNGKQTPVGRGNLSFTTINLPRLGIKHGYLWRKREEKIEGYDRESFFLELDSLIDICIEQLLERYELQKKRKVRNFPFLMGQGVWRGSEKLTSSDELGSIIDSGTLSVGFIGLAECLVGLTGHHHGESEQLQNFGLEIIGHMRERMDEATEKYHLNFSLLGTPRKWALG